MILEAHLPVSISSPSEPQCACAFEVVFPNLTTPCMIFSAAHYHEVNGHLLCNHPCCYPAHPSVGASFSWHHLIKTAMRMCGRGHICKSPHTMHDIFRCISPLSEWSSSIIYYHPSCHLVCPFFGAALGLIHPVTVVLLYLPWSIKVVLSSKGENAHIFTILGMWKLCSISYLATQFQNENTITQQSTSVEEDHWTVVMWVSFQTFLFHSIIATTPLLFL